VVEEGIWMEKGGERRKIEAKGYEHRIGEVIVLEDVAKHCTL
jgi:hypothetical protein